MLALGLTSTGTMTIMKQTNAADQVSPVIRITVGPARMDAPTLSRADTVISMNARVSKGSHTSGRPQCPKAARDDTAMIMVVMVPTVSACTPALAGYPARTESHSNARPTGSQAYARCNIARRGSRKVRDPRQRDNLMAWRIAATTNTDPVTEWYGYNIQQGTNSTVGAIAIASRRLNCVGGCDRSDAAPTSFG